MIDSVFKTKEKHNEWQKQWNKLNRDKIYPYHIKYMKSYRLKYPEKIKRHRKNWQFIYSQKMNQFKNKPCFDCQGWFEPCQLDFDHRPNEIKTFEIGSRRYSSAIRLAKEIAKCDLVCSNCHRLRTWKRLKGQNI